MTRKYTKRKVLSDKPKGIGMMDSMALEAQRQKEAQEAVPKYQMTVKVGGKVYKGQGDSIFEALSSIEKPAKIMTKTVLTLSDGTKEIQKFYMPVQAKRLFFKIAQPFQAKNLEFMLK